ncbi:hypothetical protein PHMEG_00011549 [Phytophthora megakarya]|uniref:Uncharacterized protein n=1 Tax=Phytophthora megakarya TaxID=4795 RepID=A0A225WAZ1_9STRA|nr:hypothetical protein PHMEG_00011549 [Phytophthora megakarya]
MFSQPKYVTVACCKSCFLESTYIGAHFSRENWSRVYCSAKFR